MSRIPSGIGTKIQASAGSHIARCASYVPRVAEAEPELQKLSDHELRKTSLGLRYRARSGEPLDKLLVEAFALVREASCRTLGMRHFDVQILGGAAIHYHSIVEMQTGEGKTLTATLPMYLAALDGKGAHLATVNDYLAARDAELLKPLYSALGMSIGIIQSQQPQPERRKAYRCDVTYGTANEMGFDFLRDRLLNRSSVDGNKDLFGQMLGVSANGSGDEAVQRGLHFMLVDEADSILIDEARTPLIISALPGEDEKIAAEAYSWAAEVCSQFIENEHYDYDHDDRTVELSLTGRQLVRGLKKPSEMDRLPLSTIYEYVQRAVKVGREMFLDRHYVVRDDEIVIVDEFTGRLAEGRKWRAGIHQAIEAQEGVEITFATNQAARITIQDLFLRYERLSGMTGTAATSRRELKKIYQVHVDQIPTNKPPIRRQLPTMVFGTSEQRWEAVADDAVEQHTLGRPVLIGTRSIDKSEHLAELLAARNIQPVILNARHVAQEAEIVSQAGQSGRVTVATNMAGRGTDIKLGDGVTDVGGLHVICTELHEAQRIDRQLIGRCGRQGDPGTFRQFLSLDDEILLLGYGPKKSAKLVAQGEKATKPLKGLESLFRKAQQRVERRHFRDRKVMLYHEKERQKVQLQMGQDPYLDTPG